MDLLILSITPTNELKRGRKGRNWGKERKEAKRKEKVEFGLQERISGLKWGQICASLPGYMTASPFHLPLAGPPCPGRTGPWQKDAKGNCKLSNQVPDPWQCCTSGNTLPSSSLLCIRRD